jgi:hypothetical protein
LYDKTSSGESVATTHKAKRHQKTGGKSMRRQTFIQFVRLAFDADGDLSDLKRQHLYAKAAKKGAQKRVVDVMKRSISIFKV